MVGMTGFEAGGLLSPGPEIFGHKNGRDDWIRTSGLCVPNAALYQTEPHPDCGVKDTPGCAIGEWRIAIGGLPGPAGTLYQTEPHPDRGVKDTQLKGSGFRVQGSGFRVQGSGLRLQGSRFSVQG